MVYRVSLNVGDPDNNRWSKEIVRSVINRGYKRTVAKVGSIQKAIPFPFLSGTPYYNFRLWIHDYFAVNGIYNWKTNNWIDFVSEKTLDNYRWDWERWEGEPTNTGIILDWNRVGIFPWMSKASGTFLLWFKAFPNELMMGDPPNLPPDFHNILIDWATADLLRTDREFAKAVNFSSNYYNRIEDLNRVINQIAKYDKNTVLEPYLRMGTYGRGIGGDMKFVDDITPSGPINGINPDFELPEPPYPPSSLLLTKNGQVVYEGEAYILSGSQIHFNAPYVPQGGPFTEMDDMLRAWYRVS